jgi:phage baseplate assembly protein W
MAEINLDILTQVDGNRPKEAIYKDLHLDLNSVYTRNSELNKNNEVKDLQTDSNIGAIANAFVNLLTTSPGQKPLNPLFGINFGDLLFLPVSEERADSIGTTMIDCVARFEPRIKLIKLTITPVIEQQEYICDFIYTIPRFDNERINLSGRLSRTGFYV